MPRGHRGVLVVGIEYLGAVAHRTDTPVIPGWCIFCHN